MMEKNLLSRLIISGANIKPDGFIKRDIILTKIMYYITRSKLIKMMIHEPNISLQELNNIVIPVNILAGEKDVVKYEHTKLISDNIKNSTLEIIPKENHGSYIIHSEKIYDIMIKYLN